MERHGRQVARQNHHHHPSSPLKGYRKKKTMILDQKSVSVCVFFGSGFREVIGAFWSGRLTSKNVSNKLLIHWFLGFPEASPTWSASDLRKCQSQSNCLSRAVLGGRGVCVLGRVVCVRCSWGAWCVVSLFFLGRRGGVCVCVIVGCAWCVSFLGGRGVCVCVVLR